MWLWHAGPGPLSPDELWRAYLARFDEEHAFRFAKGHLGLTAPKVRTPEQADRWVRLVMAASAQLLLARPLAADLRRPWEKRPDPARPGPPGVCRHPPPPGDPRPRRQTRPAPAGPKAPSAARHPATRSQRKPTTRVKRTRQPKGERLKPKLSSAGAAC
jgi:hypothetical protein